MMFKYLFPIILSATSYLGGTSIIDLQHELETHEQEIFMFEERLKNQELIMDTLRDTSQVEGVEKKIDRAVADIKKLQSHANETAKAMKGYKKTIQGMNQKIETLQGVLQTLMEALEVTSTYEVKSGDNLDKIAKKHKTTIKKLITINDLKNDKIFPGQTLKLP